MRSISGSFSYLFVLGLLVGCGGSAATPDAATPVDAATSDASPPDAAVADVDSAMPIDASADGGDPCDACTADEACLRGVCIATCGADLDGFDTALAAGLVPVASYCRTPSAYGFAGGRVYEVTTTIVGMVATFSLARWTPGVTSTPTVEALGITTYTASAPDELVFTGGFVAVNAAETQVVFGYTTTRAGSLGGIFDLATGSVPLAIETSAPGNFDAVFVDATHYLVDGLGLGMSGTQGIYRGVGGAMGGVHVADGVGQYSGSIALWEEQGLVLAGGGTFSENWPDGETGDRVLVFPAADLITVTAPLDSTTFQHVTMPSAFELIAGPRLASIHYDSSFAQDAIEVRELSRTGTGPVVVGAPETLTSGATFTSVGGAGEEIILAHGAGLLFVR